MKKYILQERNYEYNDEGYDRTEGGKPIGVMSDKVAAVKKVIQLNIEGFKKNSYLLDDYDFRYTLKNMLDENGERYFQEHEINELYEGFSKETLERLGDENIKKIVTKLRFPFVELLEVEELD
jgi:hypothetical protein